MKFLNLPNKLTLFRVILIIPFVLILLGGYEGWFGLETAVADWVALTLFILASVTDFVDGRIARKYNLVTNFGKFMDPLADKLLVGAALIALVEMERIPGWIVIVIISREFIISGFRLIAADSNVVIAASYWGKFKTVFQMVMVCLMIANLGTVWEWMRWLTDICMWVALGLTVISLVDYILKNKGVLSDERN